MTRNKSSTVKIFRPRVWQSEFWSNSQNLEKASIPLHTWSVDKAEAWKWFRSCKNLRSYTCKASRFQRERKRNCGGFVFGFWRFRVLERFAVCRLFVFPPDYIETLLALLMGGFMGFLWNLSLYGHVDGK
jgi:hypothetical protein